MVRTYYIVASLLAVAASSLAIDPASKLAKSIRVPGAYIFQLEDGQVSSLLLLPLFCPSFMLWLVRFFSTPIAQQG